MKKHSRGHCRSCHALIAWAHTEDNKAIPVDVTATPDGNLKLFLVGSEIQAHVIAKDEEFIGLRFKSHFSTCPESKNWRRNA